MNAWRGFAPCKGLRLSFAPCKGLRLSRGEDRVVQPAAWLAEGEVPHVRALISPDGAAAREEVDEMGAENARKEQEGEEHPHEDQRQDE